MLPSIQGKNIAQRIINTNFKSNNDVIDYFTKPMMYYNYLEIIEAFDITYSQKMEKNKRIKFPLKINYKNYPKVDFFPYKLPKTKVIQIWNYKKNVFIGDIKTDYLQLKISILPFIEDGIKLLFIAEIIKKEIFVPNKILDFILSDFERIFNLICSNYINELK